MYRLEQVEPQPLIGGPLPPGVDRSHEWRLVTTDVQGSLDQRAPESGMPTCAMLSRPLAACTVTCSK